MMMTLVYWKEYYTFFQMSIKYKMSASSCFRNITWVENKLSDDKDYQFLKTKYKSKIEKKTRRFKLISILPCWVINFFEFIPLRVFSLLLCWFFSYPK
ncbi:hypothetical protein SAP269_01490 [Spiroplasma ixodetis]|uniref:Transposase Helix-turn-helix domain-containing protein n=1 Tax=Spiroplasma ixodetis TaxID=2141 RepID=A0ABN7BTA1_9MOLU